MGANTSLDSTIQQNAYGENISKDFEALISRIEGVLSIRFKNDKTGKNLESELAKYKDLIKNGVLDAQKLQAALDNKSKSQQRKEELENRRKLHQLDLEVAKQLGDKEKQREAEKNLKADKRDEKHLKASQALADAGKKTASALLNGALNFGKFFDTGIENYASIFSKYSASVEARLQDGSDRDNKRFKSFVNDVKTNLAASPYLKQETMLNNLNELIQAGVNYNIEQRAFLQSMTDKVVTTFDAFDSNLLNLIRLQQSDSTAARMGMEASLTKSLNLMFKDTSYLSNGYDSVSKALFDTITQLGRDEGLAFEYVVQKWLGSLGSVGVGTDTLTKIATAINYLGTGNIEALQNDTSMMNLISIAANKQGLDIGSLATQGLNSTTTNILLRGIVDQIQEIAQNDNQVVRQQFGQLFGGVSMADMVAALNLNTSQLDTVQEALIDFKSATKEAQNQLNQVSDRMHISEMVNNVFDNIMATTSANIAGNARTYMLWKSLNIIEGLTGGINIPTVGALGSFVDLETTVTGLMKSGIAGLYMLGTLVSAVGNLQNNGGLSLASWGGEEYLQRGKGFQGVTSGYQVTTSRSTTLVSSSGADMANHSITAAQEEGNQKIEGAKSQETATERMLKAIMKAVTGSDDPENGSDRIYVVLDNNNATPLQVEVNNKPGQPIEIKGLY